MNVQRAELLERLSTAHNFCNLDDEDNYIAASKAVRQVRGYDLKIKCKCAVIMRNQKNVDSALRLDFVSPMLCFYSCAASHSYSHHVFA